jgi:hypothetical protein
MVGLIYGCVILQLYVLSSDSPALQALCTEAALNAIQRRYPQIYQSSDRLLLKPETIGVTFRDFMISIKSTFFFIQYSYGMTDISFLELVPSSARSSSSSASPLPTQLVPLLSDTLEKVKDAINRVLPVSKKRTALEEAMWEEDSEAHALDRELFIQCEYWQLVNRRSC